MRTRNNRKGQQAVIAGLIIVLIVAIALVLIAEKVGDIDTSKDLCKLSVLKKAESMIAGIGTDSYISCSTNYVKINKKGIYLDDKLDVSFKGNTKSTSEEQIKSFLADQMYLCWNQFLEGKVDFIGSLTLDNTFRCFVCSNINFEENYLEGFNYGDWEDYLKNKEIKEGLNYLDYLTSNNDKKTSLYESQYHNKEISSKKGDNLMVSFIAVDQSLLLPFFAPYVTKEIEGYQTSFRADIYLINADDFQYTCDQIY
jgi:hypothetical protein